MAWGKKKNQGVSYFGTNVTLEGRLCFTGVIRLDGRVNGDIISDGLLTVAESAVVTGNILVENLVLNGTVYGNIRAFKHAQLTHTSKVYGHISYGELSFEGAWHDGSSHKLSPEEIEKAQQECLQIMEDMNSNAEKSKPDEAALEQFSSSLTVNAEKQANVLLGKKADNAALGPNKKYHGHHGKSAHGGKHGGGPATKTPVPAAKEGEALKIATKTGKSEDASKPLEIATPKKTEGAGGNNAAGGKKPEAASVGNGGEVPAKKPESASGETPAKRPEAVNNELPAKKPETVSGEAPVKKPEAAKSEAANGGGEAQKKADSAVKNWDSIKKPGAPAKNEAQGERAENAAPAKKEEKKAEA